MATIFPTFIGKSEEQNQPKTSIGEKGKARIVDCNYCSHFHLQVNQPKMKNEFRIIVWSLVATIVPTFIGKSTKDEKWEGWEGQG